MKKQFSASAILLFGTTAMAQLDPTVSTPPTAKKVPKELKIHGLTLVDDYAWLREKSNKDVIDHLTAENTYTQAVMKPTAALQDSLYREFVKRLKETDSSLPVFDNGYWYYSRTVKGLEYPMSCRRKGSMKGKEEVILDLNELGKGLKFISAGASSVSPNTQLLAYTIDTTGFREYQLYLKDLKTGKLLPDKLGKVLQVAWANDNKTVFYVTEDAAKRWNQVWRYKIGSNKPELVYDETDRLYWFSIGASKDNKYLFLNSASAETSEIRFLDLDKPESQPVMIEPRSGKHEYDVDYRDGQFYIRTNDQGRNFRLVTTPVSSPGKASWKALIPYRKGVMLSGVDLYRDFMLVNERTNGFSKLRYYSFASKKYTDVATRDQPCDIGSVGLPDPTTAKFRYSYTSLTTPNTIFELDPKTGKSKVLKAQPVLGGFKSTDYVSELHWAPARDGVKIPVSLVYKKGTKKSAETPLLLYGYGSYGSTNDPYFSTSRLSLLDRGVIFAIAHIRGGGEFGKPWHDAGKMETKMNTFTDFIDCGDYLVSKKYTSHAKMAMQGGSAGGLLMGAVLNLRGDFVGQAIADVPFVDVINTMLDDTLPLTTGEWLEWGNPAIKEQFDWMFAYSPYDNVGAKEYPKLLVNTSLNDSQVLYHEPAKWVAKLRELKTDKNVLILKTNMDAGHGGASGRYSNLKEAAFDYAFLLWNWGIKK